MKFPKLSFAVTGILLGTSGLALADNNEGFLPLFSEHDLQLRIRPRYEYADVDGGADAANAFTVRTVLSGGFYRVAGIPDTEAHLEITNVSHFGFMDEFVPEQKGYDVIMDPSQTRVTQAHLNYKLGKTTFIAGRSLQVFDNQRFIGHVGWRQMPQTFDMIAVNDKSVDGLSLTGAYVTRANRIFADARRALDTNTVLLHGNYTVAPAFKLSAYGYLLASIHDTFGVRATGKTGFSGVKVSYEAEYAFQGKPSFEEESMGSVKPDHEANYYKLGFRANYSGFVTGVDYEVLGEKDGSGGGAFSTPLATLHGMNGWADKFLATPANGLVDTSFTLGYINKQFGRLIGIYHSFESDNGGDDYGSEVDVIYAYPVYKNLGLILKAAFYDEGDGLANNDTTKYWAMLDYKFNFK